MGSFAIKAVFTTAVILLGIFLGAVAFLPPEIARLPYEKFGPLGIIATIIITFLASVVLVYLYLTLIRIIKLVVFEVFARKSEIITGQKNIKDYMKKVVQGSSSYLGITGSRMRDVLYLKAIEDHLTINPNVVHTRVLFGRPKTIDGLQHIQRLRVIRPVENAREGETSIHIGLYLHNPVQEWTEPERNYCISEKLGVVILHSHTGLANFDCALLVRDRAILKGWHDYTEALYAASDTKIRRQQDLSLLEQ